MTERQIQFALWEAMKASTVVMMSNYTPLNWWECDVFAVTKANYFHEYEIKLTLADFKKDAQKKKWRCRMSLDEESKYERMEAKDINGPTAFWYITPEDMIGPDDVPEWAGLMYARAGECSGRVSLRRIKGAPRRHAARITTQIIDHAMSVSYWRFWKEVGKNGTLERKLAK